ncbi:MAG TPA: cobalt ECF transporter T component CbiQ [Candidatus Acidoferrales bacterium]|nr:cobalt ECF transporter T component CbiQ [Candidatus Acidoferrales bacterium]
MSAGFVERSISGITEALEHAIFSEDAARRSGLLQSLDPRAKIVGIFALVVGTAVAHRLDVIGIFAAVALVLAIVSRVSLMELAKRVWFAVLAFTAVIALPGIFITPGTVVWRAPALGWTITEQGLRGAALLIARVETASTLTVLLVLCTPWMRVLRALRALRVPLELVVVLGMTYRYIFLLMESAREMFEARRSRTVGQLPSSQRRHMAASAAGVLLQRTVELSGEVHMAMLARGFRGEVYVLEEERMRAIDYVFAFVAVSFAVVVAWMGR